jgi:hypothetical protein
MTKAGESGPCIVQEVFMWVASQSVGVSSDLRWRRLLLTHANAVDIPLCVCQCLRTLRAVLQKSHNDWGKRQDGSEGDEFTSNMASPLTTGSTLAHGLVSDASATILSHKRYRIVLLLVRFGHLSDIGPLPAPQRGALAPSYCIYASRVS